MRYLLDATFAIDWLRADRSAIARMERLMADGDQAFVNEVVVCELATGGPDDPAVHGFIRGVEFIQPGPDTAITAGRWRGEARRRGRTISVPDVLIAAAAHDLGATLITRNVRDFADLPIEVETY